MTMLSCLAFVLSVWSFGLWGDVTYTWLCPPTSSNLIQIYFHGYKQRFVSMVIPSHIKLTIKMRHLNVKKVASCLKRHYLQFENHHVM